MARRRLLDRRAELRSGTRREYLVHEWDDGNDDCTVELPPGFEWSVTASFGNGQLAVRVARSADADRGADGRPQAEQLANVSA